MFGSRLHPVEKETQCSSRQSVNWHSNFWRDVLCVPGLGQPVQAGGQFTRREQLVEQQLLHSLAVSQLIAKVCKEHLESKDIIIIFPCMEKDHSKVRANYSEANERTQGNPILLKKNNKKIKKPESNFAFSHSSHKTKDNPLIHWVFNFSVVGGWWGGWVGGWGWGGRVGMERKREHIFKKYWTLQKHESKKKNSQKGTCKNN